LIIWGEDIKCHLPGDALLNLKEHGFDSRKRIIRSRGWRPVLENLIEAKVRHFRKLVEIDDLMGQKKISEAAINWHTRTK
jgi:tetrahydromethanopterin S-methyltransferase subunit A